MGAGISGVDVSKAGEGSTNFAAQAGFVTQQMTAVAANIEHLLLLSEDADLRVRQLRERLTLARAQRERTRPSPGSDAAAHAEELQAWQNRYDGVVQGLTQDLEAARLEVARLAEALKQAQGELQRMQGDALPAAQARDAQEALSHQDRERLRLEAELDSHAQELRELAAGGRQTDGFTKKPMASQALSGPEQDSPLSVPPQAAEESGPMVEQREQLDEFVRLIGTMLRNNRAGRAGNKSVAWNTTPINAMTATLQSRWGAFVSQMNVEGWMDVNQLIQWVMREAYVNNSEDLKFYAHRVRFFTELKRRIRNELTRARAFQSKHQKVSDGNSYLDAPFDPLEFSALPEVAPDGSLVPREPSKKASTESSQALEDYIKDLDQMLNTVGDDAQLAQVDLQSMSQKQQQTLQTLSNLSKVMHETSMAIIRKIGS